MKFLLIFLISFQCFAQDVVKLNQGDVAPYAGALFTVEKVNDMRVRDQKAKLDRKENIVLKDLRLTDKEIIKHHKADAKKQREKLSKAEFDSFLYKTLYFTLGVVLTGFAFKLNNKIQEI